jgi:hypothetical protein
MLSASGPLLSSPLLFSSQGNHSQILSLLPVFLLRFLLVFFPDAKPLMKKKQ